MYAVAPGPLPAETGAAEVAGVDSPPADVAGALDASLDDVLDFAQALNTRALARLNANSFSMRIVETLYRRPAGPSTA